MDAAARAGAVLAFVVQATSSVGYLYDRSRVPLFALVFLALGCFFAIVVSLVLICRRRRPSIEVVSLKEHRLPYYSRWIQRVGLVWLVISLGLFVGLFWWCQLSSDEPPVGRSAFDPPSERRYRPGFFTPVEVFALGGDGASVFAITSDRRRHRLAQIIDPAVNNASMMSANVCALKFTVQLLPGHEAAELESIAVVVTSYQPLPPYTNTVVPRPFTDAYPYMVNIDAPSPGLTNRFAARFRVKNGQEERIGIVTFLPSQPEPFLVRINAATPGVYSFDVELTVRTKNSLSRIMLARSEEFFFESKK